MPSVFEIAAMATACVAMFGIKHTTRAAVSTGISELRMLQSEPLLDAVADYVGEK
jgi:hypothetical protein